MTSRERVLRALRHQQADRVPITDSPWATTIKRWHDEGLPEGVDPDEYFGYELGGNGADLSFRFDHQTIEETDEYTLFKDENGATKKNWKHATSTPECIAFTINTRQAYEENKHRLTFDPRRIDLDQGIESNRTQVQAGKFVACSAAFGYDWTQGVVGSETLLMEMALDPGWIKDLMLTQVELLIHCAEEMIAKGYHFDGAFLFDDNGYRNTTLFSPRMYEEIVWPVHKRACDFFNARDLPVILHTCGCVNNFVPGYIKAGFACLQPLEVKAKMDLVQLKRDYGEHLAFMGGIDVRKMALDDPGPIAEEIRTKLTVAKVGGGYIYHSDHSVPDNVSFENYKRVMELVAKYGTYD
ncbi:MAG: hypothetical protein JXQ73_28380 [Phycisphaerae bacterium]|nr:hypothetical protein [Phycisphaerae bacterium]